MKKQDEEKLRNSKKHHGETRTQIARTEEAKHKQNHETKRTKKSLAAKEYYEETRKC